MFDEIDNSGCYWLNADLGCRFESSDGRLPCTLNQICCRYVSADKIDDYIRMLLQELEEL